MRPESAKEDALRQSRGSSSGVIHGSVEQVLKRCVTKLQSDPTILDVGCGTGEFLDRLREKGFNRLSGCDGFDHGAGARAAMQFSKADMNEGLPYESEAFDVVTAIEVIEHLENPRKLVREIHRVLKPGGIAIVTTPNNESLTSLVSLVIRGYYSAFADECYPAHITPLLQVDLSRMMREAGFAGVEFAWTNQGRIPGTGLHWQSLLPVGFKGKRYSDNMLVKGTKQP